MPILATGTWINSFRQRGFTLLEVMVTMVLIGIIASFAVLSLRGSSEINRLAEEARRLAALLELNHQEAILRGEQRGVHFTERGYTFVSLVGKEWLPAADSSLLREHQLPSEFTLTLWVQNRQVQFEDNSTATPQVLLLSSGEATDFRVFFSIGKRGDPYYSVSGDITGKLSYGPTS